MIAPVHLPASAARPTGTFSGKLRLIPGLRSASPSPAPRRHCNSPSSAMYTSISFDDPGAAPGTRRGRVRGCVICCEEQSVRRRALPPPYIERRASVPYTFSMAWFPASASYG